jgi:hypothetical protein
MTVLGTSSYPCTGKEHKRTVAVHKNLRWNEGKYGGHDRTTGDKHGVTMRWNDKKRCIIWLRSFNN